VAQTFHLPIVHLVDCPGFQFRPVAESSAMIRWGVRAFARDQPWYGIIARNRFGIGGLGHRPLSHLCVRYVWPSAGSGSLLEAASRPRRDRRLTRPAGEDG
jgi:hypothetical protein